MIFISHNSRDKAIVEQIAIRLSNIFGMNNVFYDSWSIQPGDGIIDKMTEGLAKCKLFLFFVSNNSLSSEMVKLEWQNAIMKKAMGDTKFIPVRLDNCILPSVLLQSLYIDLYQNGLEAAIRQITDICEGRNTFVPQFTGISNLIALRRTEGNKIMIECVAQYYMEPITKFLFATNNQEDEISWACRDVSTFVAGFNKDVFTDKFTGSKMNGIFFDFPQAIVPGYPQIAEFSPTTHMPINVFEVFHEKTKGNWIPIPLK